jgi:hypothetical protein
MDLEPNNPLLEWTSSEGKDVFVSQCDYARRLAVVSRCDDGWYWDAGRGDEGLAASKEEAMAAAEAVVEDEVYKMAVAEAALDHRVQRLLAELEAKAGRGEEGQGEPSGL